MQHSSTFGANEQARWPLNAGEATHGRESGSTLAFTARCSACLQRKIDNDELARDKDRDLELERLRSNERIALEQAKTEQMRLANQVKLSEQRHLQQLRMEQERQSVFHSLLRTAHIGHPGAPSPGPPAYPGARGEQ